MAERNVLVDGGVDNARTLASGDTVAKLHRSLFARTDTQTTSTTGAETLYSNSITAGTFVSDTGIVVATYAGSGTNSAASKTWDLQFNGVSLLSVTLAVTIRDWELNTRIIRESNTTIRCITNFIAGNGGTNYPYTDYTTQTSLDLTSNNYNLNLIVTTATAGIATANFAFAAYYPAP